MENELAGRVVVDFSTLSKSEEELVSLLGWRILPREQICDLLGIRSGALSQRISSANNNMVGYKIESFRGVGVRLTRIGPDE